jgi:superfamily II DNA/RNA helicase
MSFDQLGLHASLTQAIAHAGYAEATEVQLEAIPPALAGADLMVSSCTGSGKTASFILPALQRVLNARADAAAQREGAEASTDSVRQTGRTPRDARSPRRGARVLVLVPTRELALQVSKAAETYGRGVKGLRIATVVGGVPYPAQIAALRAGPDILISTPGRLLDHVQSGRCELGQVELLVLDEADRMLDLGFIDDINLIASHVPAARQTMMYSATFAGHVGNLARHLLRDPKRIAVTSSTPGHVNIEQRLHWADNHNHKNALLDHILTQREIEQALVFTSTQRDADWLADRLADLGHSVASLHGGMPQGRRNRVLQGLRSQRLRVLVATDVAARGIDVPGISHVINYGMPMKAEDYVHRIGRTGRAGRNGLAVTLAERNDTDMVRRIQSFTTQPIPVTTIGGLEPKNPQPQVKTFRASGRPGDAPPARPSRARGTAFAPRQGEVFAARDAAGRPSRHAPGGGEHPRKPEGGLNAARRPARPARASGRPGAPAKAFVPR